MADVNQYKCPRCGGQLEFDPSSQNVKCPYCDTEFDVSTVADYSNMTENQIEDQMHWTSQTEQWSQDETSGLVTYICKSCGGEIIADQNTSATSCPYCGSPVVVSHQFTGLLKPDYVIPFKLNKKQAMQKYLEHLSTKQLVPDVFKDQNHIDEIKGMYVPMWLYDTNANARMQYHGTRTTSWQDHDYQYTQTSHFLISRAGSLSFDNVPVDGSTQIDNRFIESIEPFDFSQAVDFKTAYLAGYFADKYDLDANDCIAEANARIKQSTEMAFRNTINGYVSLEKQSGSVQLDNASVKYALYPVWFLSTTWNGQHYKFAMNGQTGKFVGDLPADKSKISSITLKSTIKGIIITYAAAIAGWLAGLF